MNEQSWELGNAENALLIAEHNQAVFQLVGIETPLFVTESLERAIVRVRTARAAYFCNIFPASASPVALTVIKT